MTLLGRLLAWVFPDPIHVPPARRRRIRSTCEWCGKDVAVIASTGKLWAHACTKDAPIDEDPNPTDQHDTWEEHAGLR